MALKRLDEEYCDVRKGDVVFSYRKEDSKGNPQEFPLHACIYIGDGERVQGFMSKLRICSLPMMRRDDQNEERVDYLGISSTAECKGAWYANMIGQRLDVDPIQIDEVALLAESMVPERSGLNKECKWETELKTDSARMLRDGVPLFVQGTCAHFVEFLYEQAGLDLVAQETLFNPNEPGRLAPATQIHAFWTGSYPLGGQWDDRLGEYPACLFGTRSTVA